jgi:hypothetical protein
MNKSIYILKVFFLAITLLVLTACSHQPYNKKYNASLETIHTAEVGQNIYSNINVMNTSSNKNLKSDDSFKYVVLYVEKKNNKVNILFEELVTDKTPLSKKSAYSENIFYPLDKNGETIIEFKDLEIKVLKATDSEIKYQILKD